MNEYHIVVATDDGKEYTGYSASITETFLGIEDEAQKLRNQL